MSKTKLKIQNVSLDFPGASRFSISWKRGLTVGAEPAKRVLHDVSLSLEAGDILGVVGRNGSGKSSLMKVVAGVLPPTEGTVKVHGTLSPLIELGAGFEPELTVNDNVLLYGAFLGHSIRALKRATPEILEWADLSHVRFLSLRKLSSGMVARLAFSVATHFRPDVLLLDEVLSVGDLGFVKKSQHRITEYLQKGTTAILVSHNLEAVQSLCSRAIWLNGGRVELIDEAESVVHEYRKST